MHELTSYLTQPYQTIPNQMVEGGRDPNVQESKGPRVQRSRGSKVPGSQGQRYLKGLFKYELDSKEGPSCYLLLDSLVLVRNF